MGKFKRYLSGSLSVILALSTCNVSAQNTISTEYTDEEADALSDDGNEISSSEEEDATGYSYFDDLNDVEISISTSEDVGIVYIELEELDVEDFTDIFDDNRIETAAIYEIKYLDEDGEEFFPELESFSVSVSGDVLEEGCTVNLYNGEELLEPEESDEDDVSEVLFVPDDSSYCYIVFSEFFDSISFSADFEIDNDTGLSIAIESGEDDFFDIAYIEIIEDDSFDFGEEYASSYVFSVSFYDEEDEELFPEGEFEAAITPYGIDFDDILVYSDETFELLDIETDSEEDEISLTAEDELIFAFAKDYEKETYSFESDEYTLSVTGIIYNDEYLFINEIKTDNIDVTQIEEDDEIAEVLYAANITILDEDNEEVSLKDLEVSIEAEEDKELNGNLYVYAFYDEEPELIGEVDEEGVTFETDELADKYALINVRDIEEVTFESESDDLKVIVSGDEKTLKGSNSVSSEVLDDKTVWQRQNDLEDAGYSLSVLGVIDITLLDEDEEETEPTGEVTVTISGDFIEGLETDDIFLAHFTDDEEIEFIYPVFNGNEISFSISSFSNIALVSDDGSTDTDDTGAYVLAIEELSIEFLSGATLNSNGDYVWTTSGSSSGHKFKWRVSFSVSGYDEYMAAESIEIRIPASILTDKNGNEADTVYMSFPSESEVEEMTEDEIEESLGFTYYIDETTNEIVVYNFKEILSSSAVYFEVSYATSKSTYNYYDYDPDETQDYEDASANFYAILTVQGETDFLTETVESNEVYINTSATLQSVTKNYPTLYTEWNSTWGEQPEEDEGCWYLAWTVSSYIYNPTQTYTFSLSEISMSYIALYEDNSGNVKVLTGDLDLESCVVAMKLSGGSYYRQSSSTNTPASVDYTLSADGLTSSGYRYDLIITKIPLSIISVMESEDDDWYSLTSLTITNTVSATLDPEDQVDSDSTKTSSREFSWTSPGFNQPEGYINISKEGNESGKYGTYIRYDLDDLQNGSVDSLNLIRYYITAEGYAFGFTLDDGDDEDDPYAYGQKNITYVISDDLVYPFYTDGSSINGYIYRDFFANYADIPSLSDESYNFEYISYSIYYEDAERDDDGVPLFDEDEQEYYIEEQSPQSTDVLILYIRTDETGSEYVYAGEINLKTGIVTLTDDESVSKYISSWTLSEITFSTDADGSENNLGVNGYKIITTNNYYYTKIEFETSVEIYRTSEVIDWIGTDPDEDEDADTATDAVLLRNVAELYAYIADSYDEISDDNYLGWTGAHIGDRLMGATKTSSLSKKVSSTSSSSKNRTYTITWKIAQTETSITGLGVTNYVEQESGVFYDLLPTGFYYKSGSAAVSTENGYLDESAYTVTVTDNYNDSGRQLVTVTISEPSDYYTVYISTITSWDNINDYGTSVYNIVVYKSGNGYITKGYTNEELLLKGSTLQYFTDLEESSTAASLLYDSASTSISTELAAVTNLSKKVKSEEESLYSLESEVEQNGVYSYRLRYMNTYTSLSKDLVFYDSLENYVVEEEYEEYYSLDEIEANMSSSKSLSELIADYLESLSSDDVSYVDYEYDTIEEIVAIAMEANSLSETDAIDSIETLLGTEISETATSYKESEWHGTITGFDLSQIEEQGIDPQLYFSLIAIDFSSVEYTEEVEVTDSETGETTTETVTYYYTDLSNTDIWYTEEDFYAAGYTLEDVKSFAIDCSKAASGYGFIKALYVYSTYAEGSMEGLDPNTEYVLYADAECSDAKLSVISDADGTITVTGAEASTYYLRYNEQILEFELEVIETLGTTTALDENTSYTIYSDSSCSTAVTTATTDEEGILSVEGLDVGTYYIRTGEYVLEAGTSIVAVVYMNSGAVESASGSYPETYNNVYLSLTTTDTADENFDVSGVAWIHNDYTTVKYKSTGNVRIKKVNENDVEESIQGISFRLFGTSDYGTEYDEVLYTDINGYITFDSVEAGTYTLQEYLSTSEWLMDYTEYEITIDSDGSVTLTTSGYVIIIYEDQSVSITVTENGVETTTEYTADEIAELSQTYGYDFYVYGGNVYYIITNEPRIHADIEFYKEDYEALGVGLEGVTFILEGMSDYGNSVYVTAVSDEDGLVTFSDIELGIYTLTEVYTIDGYMTNSVSYTVRVTELGNVYITGDYLTDTIDEEGIKIYNLTYRSIQLQKKSSYDYSAIGGIVFHLYGTTVGGETVDIYVVSDDAGYVLFEDLDVGVYILEECEYNEEGYSYVDSDGNTIVVECDADAYSMYQIDTTQRAVVIETDGTITIDDLELNEYGNYVIINTILREEVITVIKEWADGTPTDEDGNEIVPTFHIASTHVPIVEFSLVDEDGNAVSGATFTLTIDGEDEPFVTLYSSDFPQIVALEPGTFVIEETTTPSGYSTIASSSFTINGYGYIEDSSTSTILYTSAEDTDDGVARIQFINTTT